MKSNAQKAITALRVEKKQTMEALQAERLLLFQEKERMEVMDDQTFETFCLTTLDEVSLHKTNHLQGDTRRLVRQQLCYRVLEHSCDRLYGRLIELKKILTSLETYEMTYESF